MRRKLPPFIECWRDRHGKLRVYFRKSRGRRVPLPATIGSDEFESAYRTALAGQLALGREKHAGPALRPLAPSSFPTCAVRRISGCERQPRLATPGPWRRFGQSTATALLRSHSPANRYGFPSAVRRPTRDCALHAKDSADPYPSCHRYRMAYPRSVARHQATENSGNPILDRRRDCAV